MSTSHNAQKIQSAIQFFLILALIASTFAFLPQPALAADHETSTKGSGIPGTLTAKLDGRKVTITGSNFSKNRDFIANVKSGNGNASKLGALKSNDKGAFRVTFNLPATFKIGKNLTVCVKDMKSSKRTCVTIK